LTHFISPAVLLGFSSGAALLIAWHALKNLGLWPLLQPVALAEGLATLALALALQRWRPRWPVLLLALVAGTLLSVAVHRLADVDVARVGALPQAWPQWQVPALGWADVPALASQALALTLIALGQTVAVAMVLAQRSGQPLDVNRECLGQGLANVAGSFFSCFVVCGSFNRSVPHLAAGARTPLAAVLAAGLLLLLVAVAAPALAWVPLTAISALLLLVAWGLVDRAAWRELWQLDRRDAAVAGGTFVAVLLLPLHVAVLAGVAASLVVYLHRTAHPALRSMGFAAPPPVLDASGDAAAAAAAAAGVEATAPATPVVAAPTLRPFVVLAPGAPECPQLKLLRMEGSVWFGAAPHVADALQALHDAPEGPQHLLVMAKSMNFIDSAGAALWEQERVRRRAAGGDLYFHRPRPEVLRIWETGGFVQRLGQDHLFADKRSAIAAIVPRLDGAICARCRHRVFEECARQPGPDDPLR
jgi:SulP family sulfate permease